jgi:hypothetical protein
MKGANLWEKTERVNIIDLRLSDEMRFGFHIMIRLKVVPVIIRGVINSLGAHKKFSLDARLDI